MSSASSSWDARPLLEAALRNEILAPFHDQTWASSRFGVVQTFECEGAVQVFDGLGNFLGVIALAGQGISSKGRVKRPFVVLKVNGQDETQEKQRWVLSRKSEGGHVIWWSKHARQDTWDSYFVAALKKAVDFCSQTGLDTQVQDSLQMLRENAPARKLPHTVGLCTATMNRLWQLRHALPITLMHCYPHRSSCRVYVVDLGSTDGTLEWLTQNCRWAIDIGLLRVYRAEEKYWHACIGKNTAHIQAKEDIVVNVDGDNLIGAGFLEDVCKRFQDGCAVAQYEFGGGTCGRIAVRREIFLKIGGYDEDAYPMGAQDTDLVLRVKALQIGHHKKVKDTLLSQAILNTQDQKIENCEDFADRGIKKWSQMNVKNSDIFGQRRQMGILIRNQHAGIIGVPVKWWAFTPEGEFKQLSLPAKKMTTPAAETPVVEEC